MKCPLEVQRKAYGHRDVEFRQRPRQRGGWGFIYPKLGPSTGVEWDRDLESASV